MINLHRLDPGFDANGLYSVVINLPTTRYPKEPDRQAYAERLLDAAQKMPELRDATIASGAPPRASISVGHWEAEVGGTNETSPAEKSAATNDLTATVTVRPEYFALMRMPFVAGGTFDETSADRGEVVISESLAQQIWRTTSVVGRRMRMSHPFGTPLMDWMTVRGVVKNASLLSLVDSHRSLALYQTSRRVAGFSGVTLIVRAPNDQSPAAAVRRLQLAIDPALPPRPALPIADLLMKTVATYRFIMTLLTVFAGIAIALSAIGLYGVIAYMVRQRTREIGVRMALGANARDIRRLVLSHGVGLAVIGLLFGVVGAVLGGRAIRGVLYGVTPGDPVSFVLGAVGLLVVAAAACIAPMRRAVRIDPVSAMRAE
jgi:putative ABC transport system permease protein